MRSILYSLYFISIVFFLSSCLNQGNKECTKNPYEDDYRNIASISNRQEWHSANVHDPSCIKVGDTYYLYSTDAYYIPPNIIFKDDSTVHIGCIPIRSSKDLVHWKFEGWAFDSIPQDAFDFVKEANEGKSPESIWAPYVHQVGEEFRLYYSLSYFGKNGSCIGLATSDSPLGPWVDKGIVVKTLYEDEMNAIDPSVINDPKTGRSWMYYGSSFGGLYCVELNTETGLTINPEDKGHMVACRGDQANRVIEAPEIIYNKEQGMYYLFVSYDPFFSFYNIRVGRSKSPYGPFVDCFGADLKDTTNNYPILTHSYMFKGHPGWSGNAHCAVIEDDGNYFLMHQGRLAPDNLMFRLHVKVVRWLSNGWPVLSPERYNPFVKQSLAESKELDGDWEIIEIKDLPDQLKLKQGQVPQEEWSYTPEAYNLSRKIKFNKDGAIEDDKTVFISYNSNGGFLYLKNNKNEITECAVLRAWDWENEKETIVFTGILNNGNGIWGKKVPKSRK